MAERDAAVRLDIPDLDGLAGEIAEDAVGNWSYEDAYDVRMTFEQWRLLRGKIISAICWYLRDRHSGR